MFRRPESLVGVVAFVVGVLGWIYAIFGPTGQIVETTSNSDGPTMQSETRWTSLWREEDFGPILVTFLLVMLLSFIGVLLGSILRSRSHLDPGKVTLWVSASVLMAGTFLSALSIGLFFVPGTALALIAAILASTAPSRLQDETVT